MGSGPHILKNPTSEDYVFSSTLSTFVKVKHSRNADSFAYKARSDSNWAFGNIVRFLYFQKERVQRKEITTGTLRNYTKTLKMFCEITDIVIPWKKITRGLPKVRRYADDRAPTMEEIHKIIE